MVDQWLQSTGCPWLIIEEHLSDVQYIKYFRTMTGPLGGFAPFRRKYHIGSYIIPASAEQVYYSEDLHFKPHFLLTSAIAHNYINEMYSD